MQKVEELLKKEKPVDWADDISDALKEELEASIKEADRGETIPRSRAVVTHGEEAMARLRT